MNLSVSPDTLLKCCIIILLSSVCITYTVYMTFMLAMDFSPIRQNFEKSQNRQKYHHILKEHPTFTKIAKFCCEML